MLHIEAVDIQNRYHEHGPSIANGRRSLPWLPYSPSDLTPAQRVSIRPLRCRSTRKWSTSPLPSLGRARPRKRLDTRRIPRARKPRVLRFRMPLLRWITIPIGSSPGFALSITHNSGSPEPVLAEEIRTQVRYFAERHGRR